jgi:hypothetical protein
MATRRQVPRRSIRLRGLERARFDETRFFLPVLVLSRLFRRLMLERLAAAHAARKLTFFGSDAPLADPSAFAAFLAPLRTRRWFVYAKEPFAGPKQVLAYLSRYTTSSTRTATTSQPRSLLSIAKLNRARSLFLPSICSFVRIDQTWLGRNGGFAPTSLPLFYGTPTGLTDVAACTFLWSVSLLERQTNMRLRLPNRLI